MASSESYAIPGRSGRTLRAACSRSTSYLYVLSSLTDSGGMIQHFRWSVDRDIMLPVAEETFPVVTLDDEQVSFDAGLYLYGADIVVVGRGLTSSALYLMRKSWGRIGVTAEAYQGFRNEAVRIEDPSWRYSTATGWSADPSELAPLPITSAGPVSAIVHHDRVIMATVRATGATRTAEVWYSRHVSPRWHRLPFTAALGTAGSTYLGGTLQLQPQLPARTADVAVTALTAVAGKLPAKINVAWTQVPVIS